MLRWLKNKSRSTQADVYTGTNSVTSSYYRYGFHSSHIENPDTTTKAHSEDCFNQTAPHCKPIQQHMSTEHIYEDIDEDIAQAVPYSITSLDDLIENENHLSSVHFKEPLASCLSSDSGLDSRQSSIEDAASTSSSSYQPISGPSPDNVPTSSSYYQPVTTLSDLTQHTVTRQKKLTKIKSKASSIFRVRKCKRWISNHFNATKARQDSSDEDYPQVYVVRPRFESTRQFTRRRLALKKIEDHWFDSDDDSSVSSEDSFYSRMDISDLCQDPVIPTSEASTQCDIESDSGCSSQPASPSLSANVNEESSKEDVLSSEEAEDERPSFNPKTGFGLNRWYRP